MTSAVGYVPYTGTGPTAESTFLREAFGWNPVFPEATPELHGAAPPDLDHLRSALTPLRALEFVVAEGPNGLLVGAVLRSMGFRGRLILLPYLNPHRFEHLAAAHWYARCAAPGDGVFLGSPRSAALWRALGVPARVGEPYGIDGARFRRRAHADAVRRRLGLPSHGPMMLYAGRIEADKDIDRLLRTAVKARLLFPDLTVVLATHRIATADAEALNKTFRSDLGVFLFPDPAPEDLADLYAAASVFVTAATSPFETFGRAPAEALACGTPVVAPDYDGFSHVLDQPGGYPVPLTCQDGEPILADDRLLRTVYEVLSGPAPDRDVIAAAAARFHRTRTLCMLKDFIDTENPSLPALAPVPFTVPPEHAGALRWLPPEPAASALAGPLPDPTPLIHAVRFALGAQGCH